MSLVYRQDSALSASEVAEVAEAHLRCLPASGLSRLGPSVLGPLYATIRAHRSGLLFAAVDDGRVVGFVSGATNLKALQRAFLRRHCLRVGWALVPRLFSARMVRRVMETALYPFRKGGDGAPSPAALPSAELMSIAVLEAWRGEGVAPELYRRLAEAFRARGEPAFRIVVGESLSRAQRFYEKMGAVRVGETEVHAGERSYVYVHELADTGEQADVTGCE